MRKNMYITFRNKRQLAREALTPILLLAVLLAIKSNIPQTSRPRVDSNMATPVRSVDALSLQFGRPNVLFAPGACGEACAPAVDRLAALFAAPRFATNTSTATSEQSALSTVGLSPSSYLAVVVLDKPCLPVDAAAEAGPCAYRVRMDGDTLASGATSAFQRTVGLGPSFSPSALVRAVVPVQMAVLRALEGAASGTAPSPPLPEAVSVQAFPFPAYFVDAGSAAISSVAPIYLVIFFSLQVRVMLQYVLEEKEKKILEGMRMAGLGDAANWMGWIGTAAIKNLVLVAVLVAAAKLGNLFPRSDWLVLLVLYVVFACTAVAFTAVISTLFSQARTGGAVGMLLYILASTPSYGLENPALPLGAKLGASLLAPTAFAMANSGISRAEARGVGATFANLNDPSVTGFGVSVGQLIGMLALDAVLYVALAWYLGRVVPNEYGTTMHPLFLCTPRYWAGPSRGPASPAPSYGATAVSPGEDGRPGPASPHSQPDGGEVETRESLLSDAGGAAVPAGREGVPQLPEQRGGARIEEVDPDVTRRERVALRNLTKTYPSGGVDGKPVRALRGLDLDFYAGQITALLGPNGSGKSTTFQMLCGLFGPTAGEAWVNGRSILWDMGGARSQLGVCPQHDVLFDLLTVKEHLDLFGAIRGMEGQALQDDVLRCIADVGLGEETHQRAGSLSGGQKRRLSLAIALVGDPPVLLLDEPTTGCDAAVRRKVWTVLAAKRRAGRIIVLSSHDMAECEVLADRVCILARGRLRVAGSTRFLKREFGVGYHLALSAGGRADAAALLALVRRHVPTASLEVDKHDDGDAAAGPGSALERASREVAMTLPLASVSAFPALFDELDGSGAGLGVLGYGLETTSLDEAFMRLVGALEVERAAEEAADAEAEAGTTPAGDGAVRRPRAASTTKLEALGRLRDGVADDAVVSREGTGVRVRPGHKDEHAGAFGEAAAPSGTEAAGGGAMPKLGDPSLAARMRPQFGRQVRAMVTRRLQQLRRDKRSIALQCVLPVAFSAVSIAFSSLSNINASVEPERVTFGPEPFRQGLVEEDAAAAPTASPGLRGAPRLGARAPAFLGVPFWADSSPALATTLRGLLPGAVSDASSGVLRAVNATTAVTSGASSDEAANYLIGHPGQPGPGYQAFAVVAAAPDSGTPGAWDATLLYNTSFGAVVPAAVQVLARAVLGASGSASGAFDPLPRTLTGFVPDGSFALLGSWLAASLSAFYVAMGFAVVPGLMAIAVVKERETRIQAVQSIMGLPPTAYWLGTWLWDGLAMAFVPSAGAIVVLAIAGTFEPGQLPAVAALFILFGISTPGPAYALSFAFESAASAQTWIMLLTTLTTVVTFFTSFILDFPGLLPDDSPVKPAVSYAFQALFPPFCLARGLADVGTRAVCPNIYHPPGFPCTAPSAFDWDVTGSKLAFMALAVPFWATIILVIERLRDPAFATPRTSPDAYRDPAGAVGVARGPDGAPLVREDDDVAEERRRVGALRASDAPLVASALRKVYRGGRAPRVAVGRIDLAVPEGEIFGLLGPNGAGKTTLQKMLVGDLHPTAGTASIDGRAVGMARGAGGGSGGIGYCPQFDALMPQLTGREVLRFYADVAGVPIDEVQPCVDEALRAVDVVEFQDRPTSAYSGGNKRKLSTALAYLAAPRTVFLDEASAGVDPLARRRLWEVIWRARAGRCTVVTTHLLEEAAALCSRIGIIVTGTMACLGTPQHLKTRYGTGLQLDVECADLDGLCHALRRIAGGGGGKAADDGAGVTVVEQHGRYARLSLTVASSKAGADGSGPERPPLAAVFRALLSRDDVTDFAVTQPTLEAIFLRFARAQETAEEAERSAIA